MGDIADNLACVQARIQAACRQTGRDPDTVRLIAVSKTHDAASVAAANAAGQTDFGENYLQEAVAKIDALRDLTCAWHFIGPIQSNKTRDIATYFDWVHTVDRAKIARRLSSQRPDHLAPLQLCLQVNIDGEASKSGIAPEDVKSLAAEIAALPNIQLRGLMAIPAPTENANTQRQPFAALRRLRDELNAAGFELDTLSMGMTGDLEAAIAESATMLRVGTAIFGARD